MSDRYEPRILQLTFGRGKTQRSTEQEGWIKTYYEIREKVIVISERDLETKWKALESEVDKRLSMPSPPPPPPLDPAQLEKLPWTPYHKGHRAAWIKTEQEGAEKLVEAIKSSPDGKVEIGDYLYRFSGDQKQFISRNPTKPKENPGNGWERREHTLKNVEEAGKRLTQQ